MLLHISSYIQCVIRNVIRAGDATVRVAMHVEQNRKKSFSISAPCPPFRPPMAGLHQSIVATLLVHRWLRLEFPRRYCTASKYASEIVMLSVFCCPACLSRRVPMTGLPQSIVFMLLVDRWSRSSVNNATARLQSTHITHHTTTL